MIIFIRQSAVYICVAILVVYAWKDWFKSLCGLILLTSVMGRLDFPQSLGGIQGLNVWNILMADILLAWLANRRREGLRWDMPAHISVFLLLWLGVIFFGWIQMYLDRSQIAHLTTANLISEQLINTIKWPIVGLLLFDGCRTRHRIKLAIGTIFLLFALFTIQIVRYVPMKVVRLGALKSRDLIEEDVGISINGAAKMMSGVPWAMLAIIPLLKKKKYRYLKLGTCFISLLSLYAVTLTGSRMGYAGCGAVFVLLCGFRWKRYFLLIPFMLLIISVAFPGASRRFWTGFDETDMAGEISDNMYNITAGRNLVWPYVISKIHESPILGFGREAMQRTGVRETLEKELGKWEAVTHPHQAYLEVLLDSGLVGFVIVVGLHMVIWVHSVQLFVDNKHSLYTAAGGICLALLTGHLVAYLGGQTFYPQEIDVGLWCAIGVMLRLYVERRHLVAKINGASAPSILTSKDITVSQIPLSWG